MSDYKGGGPDGRKLVAVVHADMVGYSRLIELDDTRTLARLPECFPGATVTDWTPSGPVQSKA